MASTEPVSESIKKLFDNPAYSDLIVRCGDRKWHVHKNIVCTRSKWFERACSVAMKEAQEGVIEIEEVESGVVGGLLYYLYAVNYTYYNEISTLPTILYHVHMYMAADQFGLKGLEQLAATRFEDLARKVWLFQPTNFTMAVETVYNEAPDGDCTMRNCITNIASNNFREVFTSPNFFGFRKVTSTIPEFNADLLARLARQEPEKILDARYCQSCETTFGVPRDDVCDRYYYCPFCCVRQAKAKDGVS